MTFRLRVSGERACFPRPEFRRDRVTYDVLTPFAARAILDAIYWRPEIRWRVDIIHVLNPINFDGSIFSRPDIALRTTMLIDVDYVVEAHFDLLNPDTGNAAQHTKLFLKGARQGRYHHEPFLGVPGCRAELRLIEKGEPMPVACAVNRPTRDLGWIAHDLGEGDRRSLHFFRATMTEGAILVPPVGSVELAA